MTRGRSSCGAILVVTALLVPAALSAQWAAERDTTVRNEFGPLLSNGAAACRGACGPDCPDSCEQDFYWECVDASHFRVVRTFDCGTNDGCREHDDCLDACSVWDEDSVRMPGDLWEDRQDFFDDLWGETPVRSPLDRNFITGECSRYCHAEALAVHGPVAGIWALGHGPYDGRNVFEYTVDAPGQEEPRYRCPDGMRLVCDDGRGRCEQDDQPEEPEEPEEPEVPAAGVEIAPPGLCNDPDEPLDLSATVIGLGDPRVTWSVLSGPGTINRTTGRVTASGEGAVAVEAVSISDPEYSDRITVHFEDCTCYFHATLSGDVSRTVVEGEFALWSRPGEDAANVAGPLLQSLEPSVLQELVGADPGTVDAVIEEMRREGSLFVLKLVEGGDDVNSFNLTTMPKQDAGGVVGIAALVDGLQFVGPGELDVHSSDGGWITGVLRAQTGPEGGVALRDGMGPPPGGYDLEMFIEFRAGNPYRGAFCKPLQEE